MEHGHTPEKAKARKRVARGGGECDSDRSDRAGDEKRVGQPAQESRLGHEHVEIVEGRTDLQPPTGFPGGKAGPNGGHRDMPERDNREEGGGPEEEEGEDLARQLVVPTALGQAGDFGAAVGGHGGRHGRRGGGGKSLDRHPRPAKRGNYPNVLVLSDFGLGQGARPSQP